MAVLFQAICNLLFLVRPGNRIRRAAQGLAEDSAGIWFQVSAPRTAPAKQGQRPFQKALAPDSGLLRGVDVFFPFAGLAGDYGDVSGTRWGGTTSFRYGIRYRLHGPWCRRGICVSAGPVCGRDGGWFYGCGRCLKRLRRACVVDSDIGDMVGYRAGEGI